MRLTQAAKFNTRFISWKKIISRFSFNPFNSNIYLYLNSSNVLHSDSHASSIIIREQWQSRLIEHKHTNLSPRMHAGLRNLASKRKLQTRSRLEIESRGDTTQRYYREHGEMVTAWSALIVSGKDREIDQQGRLYIRDTHHLIYLLLGQRIGPSGRRRNCVYIMDDITRHVHRPNCHECLLCGIISVAGRINRRRVSENALSCISRNLISCDSVHPLDIDDLVLS